MDKKIIEYRELEKSNIPKHLPGYNYCGPGTKVVTSILDNIKPINDLDCGCQIHDFEYMEFAGDREKLEESDSKLIEVSKNWRKDKSYINQRRSWFGKIYDWIVSKGVEKTFAGKKMLEKLKIIDPVEFTRKLSKKSIEEDREMGAYLRNYLNK